MTWETAQGVQRLPAVPEHTPGLWLERAGGRWRGERGVAHLLEKEAGPEARSIQSSTSTVFFHIFFLVVQKTPSIKLSILSILSVQVSSVPILILLLHDRSLVLFHLATLKLNVAMTFLCIPPAFGSQLPPFSFYARSILATGWEDRPGVRSPRMSWQSVHLSFPAQATPSCSP